MNESPRNESSESTRQRGSIDGRLERAKDAALGAHDDHPSLGDEIGEATGGIAGVLLGAGIGSSAGPIGTLIGGIAGAIGGWWTGRAISEAAEKLSAEDDAQFRAHYDSSPNRLHDRDYDDVRAAYFLGHIASQNPNFVDRQFTEVEPELARGWRASPKRPYEWEQVREFASEGFRRGGERRSWTDQRKNIRADEVERRSFEERRGDEFGEVF